MQQFIGVYAIGPYTMQINTNIGLNTKSMRPKQSHYVYVNTYQLPAVEIFSLSLDFRNYAAVFLEN